VGDEALGPSEKGASMTKFTHSEIAYLAGQRLGGSPRSRPTGPSRSARSGSPTTPDLDTIDIKGYRLAASKKFRNIAENGRVTFVVDDLASVQHWRPRCVEVRGHAEALSDLSGGPLIRIHPERIISFGIDETDTPAHSLSVSSRAVE